MNKYIMSFDQGTTSSRCIIFNKKGKIVSTAQKEITQIYPKSGWVEHDPMEIWSTQIGVASEAMAKINADPSHIQAIGITNQRETAILWDKRTGKPIHNAIVWQCRRTAPQCDKLKASGLDTVIREKTGLVLDAYFSATKIQWLLDNVPNARRLAEQGNILFGTVDTWLIWNLTKGKVHATDYTNASRTMLFNIYTLKWDEELLKIFDIPESIFPEVKPSSYIYGSVDSNMFGTSIPIAGNAGDQHAALFGQTCFYPGTAKNTYGTGCFLLMNTGSKAVKSKTGLLTTIAWGIDGKVEYALEGSIFMAGASIQWLRDELRMIKHASDSEKYALSVSDSNGVYVVPAFVGLGAPYWDSYARGTIVGLSRGSSKEHIIRATLESIAYQTYDIIKAMEEDSGIKLEALKVDGGASANDFLMQFQSDILKVQVARPEVFETTALGAAYLAGLATGYWSSKDELRENWATSKNFMPSMPDEIITTLLKGWHKAVNRSIAWCE
jgi:glycerol kinase